MSEEQAPGTGHAAPTSPTSTPTPEPSADSPGRTPIRRSTQDRYIAGVCGGLGRATDVDPVIYRVVLAVLTLFGGIGVLLYALGWLLIPAESEEQSEVQKLLSGRGRSSSVLPLIAVAISTILVIAFITAGSDVAILVILAFVVLAVVLSKQRQDGRPSTEPTAAPVGPDASTPPAGAPPVPAPDPRWMPPSYRTGAYTAASFSAPWPGDPYAVPATSAEMSRGTAPPAKRERQASWLGFVTLAVAAVVGGVMVAVGVPDDSGTGVPAIAATVLVVIGLGLVVGTWAGRSRGLIAWGILTTLVLVAIATFDVPLRGGTGQRIWDPSTVAAAEAAPYRLAAGEGTLDLSDLVVAPGTTADVEASVTAGRLVVDVPADATIEVNGHVGMGHLALLTDPQRRVDRGGFNVSADYTDSPDTSRPPTGTESPDSTTEEPAGRIVLDLEVGLGELEVRRATASR
ncbi:MAG TPA: PspC domain-containing protein [Actinomycetes bacterium]|nr:PspC domain-containing protein [Actinomycetes bacterium]